MNDRCTFFPARPSVLQLRWRRDSSALISSNSFTMICSWRIDMQFALQLASHDNGHGRARLHHA